jgi:hypothetical protein
LALIEPLPLKLRQEELVVEGLVVEEPLGLKEHHYRSLQLCRMQNGFSDRVTM